MVLILEGQLLIQDEKEALAKEVPIKDGGIMGGFVLAFACI